MRLKKRHSNANLKLIIVEVNGTEELLLWCKTPPNHRTMYQPPTAKPLKLLKYYNNNNNNNNIVIKLDEIKK